jgi:hypothetical protein
VRGQSGDDRRLLVQSLLAAADNHIPRDADRHDRRFGDWIRQQVYESAETHVIASDASALVPSDASITEPTGPRQPR